MRYLVTIALLALATLGTGCSQQKLSAQDGTPTQVVEKPPDTAAFRHMSLYPPGSDDQGHIVPCTIPGMIAFQLQADIWTGARVTRSYPSWTSYSYRVEVYDPRDLETPIDINESTEYQIPFTPGTAVEDHRIVDLVLGPYNKSEPSKPYVVRVYMMRGGSKNQYAVSGVGKNYSDDDVPAVVEG